MVGHTYITFYRFSWQAVIDRANERRGKRLRPECRNIEGYLP